jgi:23S rRNA (uracil1939-C5)-methyltransferase
MHLPSDRQLVIRREVVLESLRRAGCPEVDPGRVGVVSGPELGYRLRTRFHVAAGRIGFFRRQSRELVDVSRCLLLPDAGNELLGGIRSWLAATPEVSESLEGFEIHGPGSGESAGRWVTRFFVHERWDRKLGLATKREAQGLFESFDVCDVVVTRAGKKIWGRGADRVFHRARGLDYQAPVGSFFQVNRFLLDQLVDQVVVPGSARWGRAVDLYCGVGLFSLPLARCGGQVLGVDSSGEAIKAALASARRARLDNVRFIKEDAASYAVRARFESVDLAVVDPPRGGLPAPVRESLAATLAGELRYVSCDPPAFARDAARLVRGGLELSRLVLLDLFPNTHHVELVASFRRPGRDDRFDRGLPGT